MMNIKFKTVFLKENSGHGNARRTSLKNCSNELIALMDADDISMPNRFEKQLDLFLKTSEVSIVGGQITEFVGAPTNITGKRRVPEKDAEIKDYMKKRCPMNQVSVMFKKNMVEKAGGYMDWFCEEDYYLWLRMAMTGCVFANLPDVLVNVRVGDEMSARRGGWKYFCSEVKLQAFMLKNDIISLLTFLYNVTIRFIGEVLAPIHLRTKLFHLTRSKYYEETVENRNIISRNQMPSEISYPSFSVAMCVYRGDNAGWFDTALESILRQTVKPNEIVLVVDGPIPDNIEKVIDKYRSICSDEKSSYS